MIGICLTQVAPMSCGQVAGMATCRYCRRWPVMSGYVGRRHPAGAKAHVFSAAYGTTEVVPCYKTAQIQTEEAQDVVVA